jgi:carbonic anhydrase
LRPFVPASYIHQINARASLVLLLTLVLRLRRSSGTIALRQNPFRDRWIMAFTRRSFLSALTACPLCAAAARAAGGAYWSYEDAQSWGKLDPAYQACGIGGEQSPIDLTHAVKANIRAPFLSWKPRAYKIVNNGHTIQAEASPGGFASLGGRKFELRA